MCAGVRVSRKRCACHGAQVCDLLRFKRLDVFIKDFELKSVDGSDTDPHHGSNLLSLDSNLALNLNSDLALNLNSDLALNLNLKLALSFNASLLTYLLILMFCSLVLDSLNLPDGDTVCASSQSTYANPQRTPSHVLSTQQRKRQYSHAHVLVTHASWQCL